jgi:hypothetical protein
MRPKASQKKRLSYSLGGSHFSGRDGRQGTFGKLLPLGVDLGLGGDARMDPQAVPKPKRLARLDGDRPG